MTALASALRTTQDFLGWRAYLAYLVILIASLPLWPFAWHLGLHILGAVLLIGNALVMAVWLTIAGFSASDDRKRRAARDVNRADAWFTVPGVVLLLANGVAMATARYGGFPAFLGTDFIAAGLGLLTATAVVWAFRLVPAQLRLYALAKADGPLDRTAYRSVLNRWYAWGILATVMPVLAALVMTIKPQLF